MALVPIFRWLQETFVPRNPDNLEFLQFAQHVYAVDVPVASSSFGDFMYALAFAFRSVDQIAGLFTNDRKCSWVQYGNKEYDSLKTWISKNFEELSSHADCSTRHICWNLMVTFIVGLHLKKNGERVMKIDTSTKSLFDRLWDLKIYSIFVLSSIGSVCASEKATLKAENHALQCTAAGAYNAIPLNLLKLAPSVDLVLI